MLMVSPATVRLWASKGQLRSVPTPGGHRRFLRQDIEHFAQERNLTLQFPDGDALRILVVDDNEQITRYLKRLLSTRESTIVFTANDGFRAGQLVQQHHPHIILLDLMMPGLDGFSVCRRIKSDQMYKSVRIIAMTGFYSQENQQKALDAGAECCVSKPFDVDELLRILRLGKLTAWQ